jgi:hypothetical protein
MQSVGIESSIVAAIPTATSVPTPTLTPSQVDAAATAVLRLREIDANSATSTVISRAMEATIEVEGTIAAVAIATRLAQATIDAKSEATAIAEAVATEQAKATATAREFALSSIATIEAVVDVCDGKSGEFLLGPISDFIEHTNGAGIGHSGHPFSVGVSDFEVAITLINPSGSKWDHGLLFHDNGTFGDALIFRPRSLDKGWVFFDKSRPGARWEHRIRIQGEWILAGAGFLSDPEGSYYKGTDPTGNFSSGVREPNDIIISVGGNAIRSIKGRVGQTCSRVERRANRPVG